MSQSTWLAVLSLELKVWSFFLTSSLDICLKSFCTKFQVNTLNHTTAITEKPDRQSLVFHPVLKNYWFAKYFESLLAAYFGNLQWFYQIHSILFRTSSVLYNTVVPQKINFKLIEICYSPGWTMHFKHWNISFWIMIVWWLHFEKICISETIHRIVFKLFLHQFQYTEKLQKFQNRCYRVIQIWEKAFFWKFAIF